jgi:hypothetical protein
MSSKQSLVAVAMLSPGRGSTTGSSLRRRQARQRQPGTPQPQRRCHRVYCSHCRLTPPAILAHGCSGPGATRGNELGHFPPAPTMALATRSAQPTQLAHQFGGPPLDLHIAPLLARLGGRPAVIRPCMPFRACSVFPLALQVHFAPPNELQRFAPPSTRWFLLARAAKWRGPEAGM